MKPPSFDNGEKQSAEHVAVQVVRFCNGRFALRCARILTQLKTCARIVFCHLPIIEKLRKNVVVGLSTVLKVNVVQFCLQIRISVHIFWLLVQ